LAPGLQRQLGHLPGIFERLADENKEALCFHSPSKDPTDNGIGIAVAEKIHLKRCLRKTASDGVIRITKQETPQSGYGDSLD